MRVTMNGFPLLLSYCLLLYNMKLLSVPLIFNTERARYFDTALRVLRSVTLSKRRAMPKYAGVQNSRTSARSSNTRMGLTMFTEVTS